jgi:ribosomal protein L22
MGICKFVKGKRIGDAIRDLEQVVLLKKSIPMKGEYSHRKGRGMSGGAFPQRASKHFIVLLKSLAGNANNHEVDEPVIVEASANWAPAPKGKFGRIRRKRTHVTLRAIEMKIKENKKEKKK